MIAFLLAFWELAGYGSGSTAIFFPPPSAVAVKAGKLLGEGALHPHLFSTFGRVAGGLCLGGIPGLVLGLIMGWSRRVRGFLDPLVSALHAIPKTAVFPLFLIFFGIGEASKLVLVAASVFFPLLINSAAGVRQISPVHFEVAHAYGASRLAILRRVVLPGSLPLILAGVRVSVNMALVITIAVELISAQSGLGAMIWFSWQVLAIEDLYVALTVAALLGIVSAALLRRLEKLLVPWIQEKEI